MNFSKLKIGQLTANLPIIQGGMGVGISLSRLAAAVAKHGGIGVISATEIGFNFPEYQKNKFQANTKALRYHIRQARKLAPRGIFGVNLMVATTNYKKMVQTSIEEGIDIIFSGAGLPLDLPKYTINSPTMIAPIISSGRGAKIICHYWSRKYDVLPDAIVVEGPLAGGHLGFKLEELKGSPPSLVKLVKQVRQVIQPYEISFKKQIPIVAGGGIVDGFSIGQLLSNGAQGVQIGTLFAASHECDASLDWKNELVRATKNDIMIIESPVGLPGRAVKNSFLEKLGDNHKNYVCHLKCLKSCTPAHAPYCIANALINAQQGNLNDGFAFAGANVDKIRQIKPLSEIIIKLCAELAEYQPNLS